MGMDFSDIEGQEGAKKFAGPQFGIDGVREYTKVKGRPFLLNMVKPCTGLTPEEGAKIFYQTALGGVDFIKDDELLGNPSYSHPADRVKAFRKAAKAAYEESGNNVKYFVNVTSGTAEIMDNVKATVFRYLGDR